MNNILAENKITNIKLFNHKISNFGLVHGSIIRLSSDEFLNEFNENDYNELLYINADYWRFKYKNKEILNSCNITRDIFENNFFKYLIGFEEIYISETNSLVIINISFDIKFEIFKDANYELLTYYSKADNYVISFINNIFFIERYNGN